MKSMKRFGGLTGGRGITEIVLTRWTLGMIHPHNICEEVEKFFKIISMTNEQHVDKHSSQTVRDNEDVDKLVYWFSQQTPFPMNDVRMSVSTGVVGTADVNCHIPREVGLEEVSRTVGNNFENFKFKRKDKVIKHTSVTSSAKIGKEQIKMDLLTLFH